MGTNQINDWFASFFQAIENQDVDANAAQFSEQATYEVVDPFQEWVNYGVYLKGRSKIFDFFEGMINNSNVCLISTYSKRESVIILTA